MESVSSPPIGCIDRDGELIRVKIAATQKVGLKEAFVNVSANEIKTHVGQIAAKQKTWRFQDKKRK
jgi:hypothetical protein